MRFAGALAAAAVSACATSAAAGASSLGQVVCHNEGPIPVALAAGAPANQEISGELCATPSELTNGETVQLLIHGATYNHTYWDFGTFDGISYSYARDVAAAGYPTFAIDQIGTLDRGSSFHSSHPLSTDVSFDTTAYVDHEIVQDLLHGGIGGTTFGQVLEVGHSLGSGATWLEALTYHDVAGVIVTGVAHDETTDILTTMTLDLSDAILDPAFGPTSGLDPGYVTTAQNTRGTAFYNSADSDPNVIAHDEATKDVVSATDVTGLLPLVATTATRQINVPVLAMLGGDDTVFCGQEVDGATYDCSSGQAVATQEAPYYSAQAQLRACVVPHSGHDLSLALNHSVEESDAVAWARQYVGQRGSPASGAGALPSGCS